jgi:hypothetical protein
MRRSSCFAQSEVAAAAILQLDKMLLLSPKR